MEYHSGIRISECELKVQYCSPVSSLEPSYSECSYNSVDSSGSISSKGENASFFLTFIYLSILFSFLFFVRTANVLP